MLIRININQLTKTRIRHKLNSEIDTFGDLRTVCLIDNVDVAWAIFWQAAQVNQFASPIFTFFKIVDWLDRRA